MKRKIAIMTMAFTLMLGQGITAYAAPEIMPDGTVFDAEYYAQANPDVSACLGTDAGVLYQHYLTYGKAEGRLAAAPLPEEKKSDYPKKVLDIVNKERGAAGLSALSWSDELAKAADVRANEITETFEHTRPNGTSCFTVLAERGISYRSAGENIAWGQRTPESVMESWMNSPGHRANILNDGFKKLGVGYCTDEYGRSYWVQLFIG